MVLGNTIWGRIVNLDDYDAELRSVVNSIYGHTQTAARSAASLPHERPRGVAWADEGGQHSHGIETVRKGWPGLLRPEATRVE